ncbi:MAG: general stress protein [Georgenia sp.]
MPAWTDGGAGVDGLASGGAVEQDRGMAMMRKQPAPRTPTLPTGVEVASFRTYLEAQRAVDRLSDAAFPVQQVTIVGTDLRLVERITGRLTYARVAGAGAMSGAWFGLMIALLYWVFTPSGDIPLLAGILIGAAFGILFTVVSYAFTGGKRDFTSASQVVAGSYSILCAAEGAGEARRLLADAGGATRHGTAAARPAVTNPYGAPPTSPGWTPPSGTAPPSPGPTPPHAPPSPGATPPHAPQSPGPTPPGAPPARSAERPRYGLRLEDLEQADAPAEGTPAEGTPGGDDPAGGTGGAGPAEDAPADGTHGSR